MQVYLHTNHRNFLFVFIAITNHTILKETTAIDSSRNSPGGTFSLFSNEIQFTELWAKNWFWYAILFAFSCDNQPYEFGKHHGNRFFSKFPRWNFFPSFKRNSSARDTRHFVQKPGFLPVLNKIGSQTT